MTGKLATMVTEQKFETVDAYSIIDVAEATRVVGPIRSAKKVLPRTTIDLVRHATYACAIHQIDASGGAVALNHDRNAPDQTPVAAFAAEATQWAEANSFVGSVKLGLDSDEVGALSHASDAMIAEATAASAAACVPDASSVVIVSDDEETELRTALGDVRVDADLAKMLTGDANTVLVRGKTGILDHSVLSDTTATTIIGLQPLTTTARGLAVAGRSNAVIVPDFVSASGPILAALGWTTEEILARTKTLMSAMSEHDTGLFLAACERAETYMRTLTSTLPFGRPLAP